MSKPEKLYEELPKEMGTTYRQEAINKYGKHTIEHAEQALLQLGDQGFQQLKVDFKQLNQDLFDLHTTDPKSVPAQQLIARHYSMIRQFWGTANSKDTQADAYAGLGQLYVHDDRYMMIDNEPQPAFALFLQQAMTQYAETVLK